MSKSGKKEKAQAPAGTEAQAKETTTQEKSKDTEFPKRKKTWEEKICAMPLTPFHCPTIEDMETSGYSKDNKVQVFLNLDFTDYNDLGLRPDTSECRLSINTGWLDNTSNRVLAALCFFKWNGTDYERISLHENDEDLQYIALGHVAEFWAEEPMTMLQYLRKEINGCRAELRGAKREVTEDRRKELELEIIELRERYEKAEKEVSE